jgi:hypothetical protein
MGKARRSEEANHYCSRPPASKCSPCAQMLAVPREENLSKCKLPNRCLPHRRAGGRTCNPKSNREGSVGWCQSLFGMLQCRGRLSKVLHALPYRKDNSVTRRVEPAVIENQCPGSSQPLQITLPVVLSDPSLLPLMNGGRTAQTYRYERWPAISSGIIETAGSTFLLAHRGALVACGRAGQGAGGGRRQFGLMLGHGSWPRPPGQSGLVTCLAAD